MGSGGGVSVVSPGNRGEEATGVRGGVTAWHIGRRGRSWTKLLRLVLQLRSASVSDDGLGNAGLDDEEMEQVYPECMLEHLEVPPAKRVKARSSTNKSSPDQLVGETAPVPPAVTQIQNLHLCQDKQQIMRAVQLWTPEAIDTVVRLCTEHRNQEEALQGSLG